VFKPEDISRKYVGAVKTLLKMQHISISFSKVY